MISSSEGLDACRRDLFRPPDLDPSRLVTITGDVDVIYDSAEVEIFQPLGPFDYDDGVLIVEDLFKADGKSGIFAARAPQVDVVNIEAGSLVEIDQGKTRTRHLIDIEIQRG